jgi:hypothetical protein
MSPVRRPRSSLGVIRTTAVVASLCCLALTACSDDDGTSSQRSAAPAPAEAEADGTSLGDVDTTALVVPRGPFCDKVDPAAVTRALGEEPADVTAYRSGQRIKISDDVADVVHEFGCRWTAGDDTAEAWIFAPPVTRKRAGALTRDVLGPSECLDQLGPEFGRPSASCASADRDAVAISFHGLFGDAWLSCRLTLAKPTDADVGELGSRWCAAVATGASG